MENALFLFLLLGLGIPAYWYFRRRDISERKTAFSVYLSVLAIAFVANELVKERDITDSLWQIGFFLALLYVLWKATWFCGKCGAQQIRFFTPKTKCHKCGEKF